MIFDWDDNKSAENITNHNGITFKDAALAFFDEWAVDEFDDAHSTAEDSRFTLIGLSGTRLLRVTYTVWQDETNQEVIRIISARDAKGYEKREYERARNELDF